jgi:hypothetical protein
VQRLTAVDVKPVVNATPEFADFELGRAPLPINSRTRSPTFAVKALSPYQRALIDLVLMVNGRQAFGRLNQHDSLHAVANVHANGRGCAVIHVNALVQSLKSELRLVSWGRETRSRTAAWTDNAMEINVVVAFCYRDDPLDETPRCPLPAP